MKKVIFIFFTCLVMISLVTGCKKKDPSKDDKPSGGEDNPPEVTYTDNQVVERWLLENITTDLLDSTVLPTTYPEDERVSITWSSEKATDFISEATLNRNGKKLMTYNTTYTINNGETELSGNYTFKVYPKTTTAAMNWFCNQFPNEVTENVDYLENVYEFTGCSYSFTWTSGNTELLKDDGTYVKPNKDTDFVVSVTMTVAGQTYTRDITVTALSYTPLEKLEMVEDWLCYEMIPDMAISESIDFMDEDPNFGVKLSWTSSNEDVVSTKGVVNRSVYDRFVEVVCTAEVGSSSKRIYFNFKVLAADTKGLSEVELINKYLEDISYSYVEHYNFNINSGYSNITHSFASLLFYSNTWTKHNVNICPMGLGNRPGDIRKSTQFVTVHDTANNSKGADGQRHNNYVAQGGGGTSFQYVVGNDGIWQNLPIDETAYHAGDGHSSASEFMLYDTGVKATAVKPHIGISEDGYFTFNGVESKIHVPDGANAYSQICDDGLWYEIGANGNYWLNKNYYNTSFGYISNRGGNMNSVGIETCVDQGSDYYLTLIYNANLVAYLCAYYDLDVERVREHNSFSGKPCPNAMRQTHYWQIFRDQVSAIKFGMTHFDSNLTFEWVSGTSGLGSDGRIQYNVTEIDSVNYLCNVKRNGETIVAKEFNTAIRK